MMNLMQRQSRSILRNVASLSHVGRIAPESSQGPSLLFSLIESRFVLQLEIEIGIVRLI